MTPHTTAWIDTREPETNEGEGGVIVDDLPKLFEEYEALGIDDVVLGFEAPDERSTDSNVAPLALTHRSIRKRRRAAARTAPRRSSS